MRWALLFVWACGGEPAQRVTASVPNNPPAAAPAPAPAPAPPRAPEPQGPPAGVQHPPIPADNEAWHHDAGGFVANHFFYGERSWADVRMRVVGHLATVARDRARWHARRGQWRRAAKLQATAAVDIAQIDTSNSVHATQMRDLWRAAAARDAALLSGMAEGAVPSSLMAGQGRVFPARAALLQLTIRGTQATDQDRARWLEASRAMKSRPLPTDLDLDAFADFDARHALRVRLLEAYLDAVDPVGYAEPWGYWDVDALKETVAAVLRAGEAVVDGGRPPKGLSGHPATWAAQLARAGDSPQFTLAGLGGLPTGDSLIDIGGQPGPKAIGTLERLGLDDQSHVAWLRSQVAHMNKRWKYPAAVVDDIAGMVERLNQYPHGSRYYNVKQVRNAGVRQLARAGRPNLARAVLRTNRPLHHQDWACPNRAGILLAIEGRLLALAADGAAPGVLEEAASATRSFLDDVNRAVISADPAPTR